MVKANSDGKEALKGSIAKIGSEEVGLNILKSDVGNINEGDVKLASTSGAYIFGFKVSVNKMLQEVAKRNGVKVILSQVIYELVDAVKNEASKLLEVEVVRHDLGTLSILQIFGKKEEAKHLSY